MAENKNGADPSAPSTETKGADQNPPTLEAQIATLEKANQVQKESIDSLQKELAAQKKELSDAAEIIEDLKSQPKSDDNQKGKTATIGKKKYLVTGGFRGKDRVYLPEDIAADEKLLKQLIEKRSGLIKEV